MIKLETHLRKFCGSFVTLSLLHTLPYLDFLPPLLLFLLLTKHRTHSVQVSWTDRQSSSWWGQSSLTTAPVSASLWRALLWHPAPLASFSELLPWPLVFLPLTRHLYKTFQTHTEGETHRCSFWTWVRQTPYRGNSLLIRLQRIFDCFFSVNVGVNEIWHK